MITEQQIEKIIELLKKIESNTSDIARDIYDLEKIRDDVKVIKEIIEKS